MAQAHDQNSGIKWTAVVITCQNRDAAHAFQIELSNRQKIGSIDKNAILLCTEDPKCSVGSGGATLNALLLATEYLSAQQGCNVINPDVLVASNILIIHMGRNFAFDGCTGAFVTLAVTQSGNSSACGLICNIDIILDHITYKLSRHASPGIWVCSTDMILDITTDTVVEDISSDICIFCVPTSVQYATNHGVLKLSSQGDLQNIIYQGPVNEIETCVLDDGKVPMISGMLYFSAKVAQALLLLSSEPPLDCCTYLGLDSGAQPLQMSIFFDFLLACCSEVTEDEFVLGQRRNVYTGFYVNRPASAQLQHAKSLIWNKLCSVHAKAIVLHGANHCYLDWFGRTFYNLLTTGNFITDTRWTPQKHIHCIDKNAPSSDDVVIINSIIEERRTLPRGCVLLHTHLSHSPLLTIENNVVIAGLKKKDFTNVEGCVLSDTFLHCFNVKLPGVQNAAVRVMTVVGLDDNTQLPYNNDGATFCNKPWQEFFNRTGIKSDELWSKSTDNNCKMLYTARLFPVFTTNENCSLEDILWLLGGLKSSSDLDMLQRWQQSWRLSLHDIISHVDIAAEFGWRKSMYYKIAVDVVTSTLINSEARGLTNIYGNAATDGKHDVILATLDKVAYTSNDPAIAARVFANIADMLGAMAQGCGGLRSGPAGNQEWMGAFKKLEEGDITGGVHEMSRIRKQWLSRPDLLIRMARHYEGGVQILIRNAVKSAKQFMEMPSSTMVAMDTWVTASCSARADLCGGWSDTPPITYEHGGAVMNMALTIDGKKPIGAEARRTKEAHLILHLGGVHSVDTIVVTSISDMQDYCQPHAPGALIKTAFICTEIIDMNSCDSLEQQLLSKYKGGFELRTWSNLPHGSGLGTSSILAGAIMAVLWKCIGKDYTHTHLNHGILYLEQLLTTGGGWQDQVGGLMGGVKVGHSKPRLPLYVDVYQVKVSDEMIRMLNERFLLIYTGKTRLAKNLLQNVLRTWYARDPVIVNTEDRLVEMAWESAAAMEKNDLELVGTLLSEYWELKKVMAPGCESAAVASMMSALAPYVCGMSLAGAGGGGFMYVITKEPNDKQRIQNVLSDVKDAHGVTVHTISVDMAGLSLTVQGQ